MKTLYWAFCLIVFATACIAESVKNTSFQVQPNGFIEISYDIVGTGKFTVDVMASLDGGETYSIKPISVFGDVGKRINAGTGKKIQWNSLKDFSELKGDLSFLVKATPETQNLKKVELSRNKQEVNIKRTKFTLYRLSLLFDAGGSTSQTVIGGGVNYYWSFEKIALGIGYGYEGYKNGYMSPVSLDLRIYSNFDESASFNASFGYSSGKLYGLKSEAGGMFFALGVGKVIETNSNIAVFLDGGYKMQFAKNVSKNSVYIGNSPILTTEKTYDTHFNLLYISTGLRF